MSSLFIRQFFYCLSFFWTNYLNHTTVPFQPTSLFLAGKLLNVRDASKKQLLGNAEVQNIMKIMGLKLGVEYTDVSRLRYGHIMIMTDQDHDGSHIKGLIINFIHHFWPSLLEIKDFLQVFITPIVKCIPKFGNKKSKIKNTMTFYTTPEYETWREEEPGHTDGKKWRIKYYKGLGTSDRTEAKEYFSDLDRNLIPFTTMSNDPVGSNEGKSNFKRRAKCNRVYGKALVDFQFLFLFPSFQLVSLPSPHIFSYLKHPNKCIF